LTKSTEFDVYSLLLLASYKVNIRTKRNK
jgi:hypothetical protein